jgi:hypothetical protein
VSAAAERGVSADLPKKEDANPKQTQPTNQGTSQPNNQPLTARAWSEAAVFTYPAKICTLKYQTLVAGAAINSYTSISPNIPWTSGASSCFHEQPVEAESSQPTNQPTNHAPKTAEMEIAGVVTRTQLGGCIGFAQAAASAR